MLCSGARLFGMFVVYREVENGGVSGTGVSIRSVGDPVSLEFLSCLAAKSHIPRDVDL